MHSKMCQYPVAPQRILLKPNLKYERQDTTSSDARTSFDHSDKHGGTYRQTCRSEIDFRIQGLPNSAVQEHDHIRKKAVQELTHQFENHPNKEVLRQDVQQQRAFSPFSEQSKEMIYSMGNMEYFEICEITPNIQCSNCITYWPKAMFFAHAEYAYDPQTKFENSTVTAVIVLSIPNYVIKKGPSRGKRHGNTKRQRSCHQTHGSSRTAIKKGYTSIQD